LATPNGATTTAVKNILKSSRQLAAWIAAVYGFRFSFLEISGSVERTA
jgi:hypothetical protein